MAAIDGKWLSKEGLTYFWSKIKSIFTKQTETNVIVNLGAKNLFKNEKNAGATVTRQGATWVFDKASVEAKVSGNVSGTWSDVFLLNTNFDLSDKEYTIVIESDSPTVFVYITGNTLSGGNIPSNGQYYAGVYRYKGIMTTSTRFTAKTASYSNNAIRFMICPASITDTTYVPYAPTNHELYEMILALQSGASAQSAASLMQSGRINAELSDSGEDESERQEVVETSEE
jgi:3-polyprenyl-4-hydroxybenzoate decarboxylase